MTPKCKKISYRRRDFEECVQISAAAETAKIQSKQMKELQKKDRYSSGGEINYTAKAPFHKKKRHPHNKKKAESQSSMPTQVTHLHPIQHLTSVSHLVRMATREKTVSLEMLFATVVQSKTGHISSVCKNRRHSKGVHAQ